MGLLPVGCQFPAGPNRSRQSGHGRAYRIVIRCSLVLTVGCRLLHGRHEPTPAATVNRIELNGWTSPCENHARRPDMGPAGCGRTYKGGLEIRIGIRPGVVASSPRADTPP